MAIRCAAKALIVRDGCLLLNRCRRGNSDVYYDLPGGGQHPFESMEEAVRREVMEEAGIGVRILRFAALAEEIAAQYSIPVTAKLPINPKLAGACDKGMIELYDGTWLDDVTKALENLE